MNYRIADLKLADAGRLRIDWVSAAEGNRFARVVAELTDQVRELGPWRGPQEVTGEIGPVKGAAAHER
jgi:coenzyme F420-reducing hydrogenase delta subunit